jgi:putative acetyltransferase
VAGPFEVTIRPESSTDHAAIRELSHAAFGGDDEARIVDAVRGTDDWLAGGPIVAIDRANRLVGHSLLSRGLLVGPGGERWVIGMIGPVAVAGQVQRHGIGSALMQAAITRAEQLDLPLLCLLGHADYYPRFGFRPARSLGVEPPRPWPDEAWMALPLGGWTAAMRGVARYPSAFKAD